MLGTIPGDPGDMHYAGAGAGWLVSVVSSGGRAFMNDGEIAYGGVEFSLYISADIMY